MGGGAGEEGGCTDVIDRVVGWHALSNARENVKCSIHIEECAAEVGEV